MDVRLEHTESTATTVVRIDGKATVRSAVELRAALLDAFAGARQVLVDLSGTTEIDAAFLQILCAADKSAVAAGKQFRLEGGCSEALTRSFAEAGFPLPPGMAGGRTTTLSGGDER